VQERRDPERAGDAETFRNGAQPGVTIELDILTAIDDVQAGNPEQNRKPQDERRSCQIAADRDPSADRRAGFVPRAAKFDAR